MAGTSLLAFAPMLLKFLSIVGTAAMFLVGGGILVHGLPFLHHLVESAALYSQDIPSFGTLLSSITSIALHGICGLIAGSICVGIMALIPGRTDSCRTSHLD